MTQNKELTPVNSNLQKSIDQLNAFKSQVDEMGEKCKSIVIKDADTVAIGTQNLAKANTLLKAIEDKVKLLRKPYNDELKKISEVGSKITETLSEGVKTLKDNLAAWEKKRQEEEKEKQRILEYITVGLPARLQQLYENCKTEQDYAEALTYIKEKFPKDDNFGEYVQQAHELRDKYISLIEAAQSGDTERAEFLQEATAEVTESIKEVKQEVAISGAISKTRGTRMIWKFEAQDMTKVPLEWLTVDDDKVRAYLAENKDKLKDGEVVSGIKFYKEISISA
jgi:hypothetical protein